MSARDVERQCSLNSCVQLGSSFQVSPFENQAKGCPTLVAQKCCLSVLLIRQRELGARSLVTRVCGGANWFAVNGSLIKGDVSVMLPRQLLLVLIHHRSLIRLKSVRSVGAGKSLCDENLLSRLASAMFFAHAASRNVFAIIHTRCQNSFVEQLPTRPCLLSSKHL